MNDWIDLRPSGVTFDAEAHTYHTSDGVVLSGITPVLHRQLFPAMYAGVPQDVLARAAEHGSSIHTECDLIDSLDAEPMSDEGRLYLALKDRHGLVHERSEYLVTDGVAYASAIDKVFRVGPNTFRLADIKTTYALDLDYVRWQLSIYAYMFELQNPGATVGQLSALWLRRDRAPELVDVDRIPNDVIKDLLRCDAAGERFTNPYATTLPAAVTLPAPYLQMEKAIEEIAAQEQYWAAKKKELLEGVMREMVKAGVYSWKGRSVTFSRRKESTRKALDTKLLKEELPDIYNQYVRESPVAGGVTLKITESYGK